MADQEELLRYRTEGIITELANYFEIRYEQLTRVKPELAAMHADLLWMQMDKVRTIMAGGKMFGPARLQVGNILASRDEKKRLAVMGPIDQSSIMNELVPEEDTSERRPGFLVVRSMRALFTSVDESLGRVIELTDIWLWWDIFDAADMFNFKEQKKLIEKRKTDDISERMQKYYQKAMAWREERDLKREEILSHEFAYLDLIWKNFMQRREEEESYMKMIKVDPVGGHDSIDDLILTLAGHVKARKRLGEEGGLDDRMLEYYAKVLKLEPSKVTPERAIAHEDVQILRLRVDLQAGLEQGAVFGEPYDFKVAQGKEMGRDVARYRKEIALDEKILFAASQAAAAAVAKKTPGQPAQERSQPQPTGKPIGEQETLADEEPLLF